MDEQYRLLLKQAMKYSCAYLDAAGERPPYPTEEALSVLSEFEEPLSEEGTSPEDILSLLHRCGSAATTGNMGSRYFGFVNGNLLPAAHAAAWVADTWNQNSALYVMSPVAARLEDLCERWMVNLLHLPEGTAMGLTTGSSNAIICALAAARNELLRRQGWNLPQQGLRNAPPIRVVLGEEAHASVKAALSVLGIGGEDVEVVPTDDRGRMRLDCLPELDDHTLLILQAGNMIGGAYDPIDALCDRANQAGAWVHIDGAFGLWAAASRRQYPLVAGLEKASSWSLDAHKTLNAGYDCGIVLCRSRECLASALQFNGSYIQYSSQCRDGASYTTDMSRRARAVPLWAALKSLGSRGVEEMVDAMCDHAAYFAQELKKAGFIVPAPAVFNQAVVKCDTPEKTAAVLKLVQNSGVCWCSGCEHRGEPLIRLSVCSYTTTREDIDKSAAVFRQALAAVSEKQG